METHTATIFDDVFRTMTEKFPELVIVLINEVFGTEYSCKEPVVQMRNEHQTEAGRKITDSYLQIRGESYHLECQSTQDSVMVLRMAEYDFHIGLEQAEKANRVYQLRFPWSCVLYLRGKRGQETLDMELIMQQKTIARYQVPVLRAERYTKEDILEKHLDLLLPFYLMRYEVNGNERCCSEETIHKIIKDCMDIEQYLEQEYLMKGNEKGYLDLILLIRKVADYLFSDSEEIRKGIGESMGGRVLELESERLLRVGREEGMERGRKEGMERGIRHKAMETAERMLRSRKYTIEEIVSISGLSENEVRDLKMQLRK